MLRIGYHISTALKMDMAFDRAMQLECTTMQIFLTNPRTWLSKKLDAEEAEAFTGKRKGSGIDPVIAHMPYLPNLSSSEKELHKKSVASLKTNINLSEQLGIDFLVLHMGSHMGHGEQQGMSNIVASINEVLDIPKNSMLLLENSAGQRNSVGSKMEELAAVYEAIGSKKIGFCLDTCHLFAAGYDIRDKDVLDKMDKALGLSLVKAIHLNDAKHGLGSGLDRHANIGYGEINKGFRTFLNYKSIKEKAMVLETPYNQKLEPGEELSIVRKMLA